MHAPGSLSVPLWAERQTDGAINIGCRTDHGDFDGHVTAARDRWVLVGETGARVSGPVRWDGACFVLGDADVVDVPAELRLPGD